MLCRDRRGFGNSTRDDMDYIELYWRQIQQERGNLSSILPVTVQYNKVQMLHRLIDGEMIIDNRTEVVRREKQCCPLRAFGLWCGPHTWPTCSAMCPP